MGRAVSSCTKMTPRAVPCAACPYRKDAPSGLWDQAEYEKLPHYDRPTAEQPPGVFLCHDADRDSVICRGWLEVHGQQERGHELLSLRLAGAFQKLDDSAFRVFPLPPCGIELHESGQAACDAGMVDYEQRSERTRKMARKLKSKHPDLKGN